MRSRDGTMLTGTEYSQHPHIAGGGVASGIGGHPVQRPVAAVTGQFPYA
jgi:hypothetical protein